MSKAQHRILMSLTVAGALVLGACGGSDESSTDGSEVEIATTLEETEVSVQSTEVSVPSTEAVATTDTATADADPTTSDDASVATTDAVPAEDVDPEVCEAADDVKEAFDIGEVAESDEEFVAAFDGFATALEGFAAVAPDSIVDVATSYAEDTRTVADAAAEPDIDFDEDPPAEILAILEGEEYNTASESLATYLVETCNVDLT